MTKDSKHELTVKPRKAREDIKRAASEERAPKTDDSDRK